MSQHYRDTLAEFHAAFGVQPYSRMNRTERLALVALRATLIEEETRELLKALSDAFQEPSPENQENLAKEAADLLYVTAGTSQLLGCPLVDPDVSTATPKTPYFSVGVAIWASKEAQAELDSLILLMDQEYPEEDIDFAISDLGPALQSLVDVLFGFADAHRIPLHDVFDAVHESNMSKLDPDTGEPVLRSDGKVLKGSGYFEPDIRRVLEQAA